MTKREKVYHFKKAILKYDVSVFSNEVWWNMVEFGIGGSQVYLDEDGNVKVRVLSIEECYELKDKLPIEGITIEEVKH